MKQVFNNRQLAHVWAQQSQAEGRNSSRSMFFEGNTIYSYGYHYAIATMYFKGLEKLVLVNEHGYSNITGKQRNDVLRAIKYTNYIYVPRPTNLECEDNETHLYNQVMSNIDALMSIRTKNTSFDWLENSIKNLNLYLSFIGKPSFKLDDVYYDTLKEINKIRIDRNFENEQKKQLKLEKENRLLKEEHATYVAQWLSGQQVTKRIKWDLFKTDFKNAELIRIKPNNPDIVETNQGAEVPLSHALRLLKLVLNKEAKQGERVGHFTVDKVEDKTLKIGCHVINIDQAKEVLSSQLLTDNVG